MKTIGKALVLISLGIGVLLAVGSWAHRSPGDLVRETMPWASPGDLSRAHQHLANDCSACHTAVTGVETTTCILCHANAEALLQRQPTAFHASVPTCVECHREHRGLETPLTAMDHEAIARLAAERLSSAEEGTEARLMLQVVEERVRLELRPHEGISAMEATLECSSCHANDDPHQDAFGADCAQCHATDRWTLAAFEHPSPASPDCGQCHRAPPSHYMGHFGMISRRVAGRPRAAANECGQCHQTTSWNDIKRVGVYDHH
jgi:hypothetical protein